MGKESIVTYEKIHKNQIKAAWDMFSITHFFLFVSNNLQNWAQREEDKHTVIKDIADGLL